MSCLTYFENPVNLKCGYVCCPCTVLLLFRGFSGHQIQKPTGQIGFKSQGVRASAKNYSADEPMDAEVPRGYDFACWHSQQTTSFLRTWGMFPLGASKRTGGLVLRDSTMQFVSCALLSSPLVTVTGRTSKEWDVGVCKESVHWQGVILLSS